MLLDFTQVRTPLWPVKKGLVEPYQILLGSMVLFGISLMAVARYITLGYKMKGKA